MIVLCEKYFPYNGEHEIFSIVPLSPCYECGQYDNCPDALVHAYPQDPRKNMNPEAEAKIDELFTKYANHRHGTYLAIRDGMLWALEEAHKIAKNNKTAPGIRHGIAIFANDIFMFEGWVEKALQEKNVQTDHETA